MLYLIENFKSAIQNIKSNKMRSFLTMLGIIIGISSVITIVSLGQGGKQYITGQFESIGTNVIDIGIASSKNNITSADYFTMEDVNAIKEKVPKVMYSVPIMQAMGRAKTEKGSKMVQVTATTADAIKVQNLEILYGRFLKERDIDVSANVAVIDDTMAENMFHTKNAVGEKINVMIQDNTASLTIVGIIKNPAGSMASAFGDRMPGFVIMPISLKDKLMPNLKLSSISVALSDMNDSNETSSKIIRLLELRHNTSGKYTAQEAFKQLDRINNVLSMLTSVIGAIAGISLLVGGIGVMNIMLVSVTERTREIGIRKALGATTKDIRLQFLTESLILCLVGGGIGMSLGILIGRLAGKFINITAYVSISVVLISFIFSSAVGIFFGLYPANKAAKLDPIEALRYE